MKRPGVQVLPWIPGLWKPDQGTANEDDVRQRSDTDECQKFSGLAT